MRVTLTLTEPVAALLRKEAGRPVECGGFVTARLVQIGEQLRLLARDYFPVDPSHYELQDEGEMIVRSEGLVPALAAAARDGSIALWFHTHPGVGATPVPSAYDRKVDVDLAESVRIRTDQDYYGTLILSPDEGRNFTFTGTLQSSSACYQIDRVLIVGTRILLKPAFDAARGMVSAYHDRNVRAFGSGIQSALGELTVGVVGCGGTGSAVAEQLARLGVRDFVLIDPKDLSESNVTRVYGSNPGLVAHPKAEVARENVLRIAPETRCRVVIGKLSTSGVARELVGCDVVFGCTDDEAGRLVLSRVSTYLLCPVIDCGVLISSDESGAISGIDGRVTVVSPGSACLVCRNRIDVRLAAAQMLPEHEQSIRVTEGYAPALGRVEPAVVTFTTSVAAAAVNELLERMIGFGPEPRPSEVLIRFHEREISTNYALPRPNHYCANASGKLGAGITDPFLDLGWPS